MSLTKQVRDMWYRFQRELFPELQAEVWGITCESAQVEAKAWQMPSGEWV